MSERLNRWIAHAGVASRRAADRLIEEGRVRVNGRVVRELGVRIDPDHDAVKVDGRLIRQKHRPGTYLLMNKPRGVVTTLSDPEGRPTVADLLPPARARGRVYPVGRLDFDTEGLLLLTDDGDLARDLMHPSSGVPKTYLAKVRGVPDRGALERLAAGVRVRGHRTLPARANVVRRGPNAWVEVQVVEGRKHQVRLMLAGVGHPVLKLRRIRYDGLELGDLPLGACRSLTRTEIERLRQAVPDAGRPKARRSS